MSLPDVKVLKKFADACRKAGIKSFKSADFEFTLSDEPYVKPSKRPAIKAQKKENVFLENDTIESEGHSQEELLFWSTGVADSVTSELTPEE